MENPSRLSKAAGLLRILRVCNLMHMLKTFHRICFQLVVIRPDQSAWGGKSWRCLAVLKERSVYELVNHGDLLHGRCNGCYWTEFSPWRKTMSVLKVFSVLLLPLPIINWVKGNLALQHVRGAGTYLKCCSSHQKDALECNHLAPVVLKESHWLILWQTKKCLSNHIWSSGVSGYFTFSEGQKWSLTVITLRIRVMFLAFRLLSFQDCISVSSHILFWHAAQLFSTFSTCSFTLFQFLFFWDSPTSSCHLPSAPFLPLQQAL